MDIKYSDGNFYFIGSKRDIPITADHVIQNLAHRLDTTVGEHFYWTDYGTTIKKNIGEPNSQETHLKVWAAIEDALIQDTRIPDNSSWIQMVTTTDAIEATVKVGEKELTKTIGDY